MVATGRPSPGWLERQTPLGRDILLAAALSLGSALLLLTATGPVAASLGLTFSVAEVALTTGLVVAQTMVLAVRRVRPRTCLVVVAALQLMITAVLPPGVEVRFLGPVAAAYTVGLVLRPWVRALGWVAAVAAAEVALAAVVARVVAPPLRAAVFGASAEAAPGRDAIITALLVMVLYGSAAVFGLWVAARRENVSLVEARAAAELQEQQGRTTRAVEAERRRMARELHDIATHHLTGLVVQAAAVERLIERDPQRAREATKSLRTQGKDALANLRSVVGVLRETETNDAAAQPEAALGVPVAGLAQLEDLIADARQLGDQIVLTVDGEAYELAPVADVTAYRILQESLTNARQHAPGEPVSVRLAYAPDRLEIDVTNAVPHVPRTAAPGRTGYGMIGMHERAQIAAGRLQAGPEEDGGWRVQLTLPQPTPPDSGDPTETRPS